MAWWFLAPVVIGLGKVIYDAVTEDSSSSSSSSSSSNYEEQKRKAEEQAQREQKEKEKTERKRKLIGTLVSNVNSNLNEIKEGWISNPNNIHFKTNNVETLTKFSAYKIDEANSQTALEALSVLTDNHLGLNSSKETLQEKERLLKKSCELQSVEKFLINELQKAS